MAVLQQQRSHGLWHRAGAEWNPWSEVGVACNSTGVLTLPTDPLKLKSHTKAVNERNLRQDASLRGDTQALASPGSRKLPTNYSTSTSSANPTTPTMHLQNATLSKNLPPPPPITSRPHLPHRRINHSTSTLSPRSRTPPLQPKNLNFQWTSETTLLHNHRSVECRTDQQFKKINSTSRNARRGWRHGSGDARRG